MRATRTNPRLMLHERALMRATSDEGISCIGTHRALYWRSTAPGTGDWLRAAWSDMDEVDWRRATHTLTLRTTSQSLVLHLGGHSRLPGFAEERVAAAHVLRQRVRVSTSCCGTIDAVHDPDTGDVVWTVVYDKACDLGDPTVVSAMNAAVREVRVQAGC